MFGDVAAVLSQWLILRNENAQNRDTTVSRILAIHISTTVNIRVYLLPVISVKYYCTVKGKIN